MSLQVYKLEQADRTHRRKHSYSGYIQYTLVEYVQVCYLYDLKHRTLAAIGDIQRLYNKNICSS